MMIPSKHERTIMVIIIFQRADVMNKEKNFSAFLNCTFLLCICWYKYLILTLLMRIKLYTYLVYAYAFIFMLKFIGKS